MLRRHGRNGRNGRNSGHPGGGVATITDGRFPGPLRNYGGRVASGTNYEAEEDADDLEVKCPHSVTSRINALKIDTSQ